MRVLHTALTGAAGLSAVPLSKQVVKLIDSKLAHLDSTYDWPQFEQEMESLWAPDPVMDNVEGMPGRARYEGLREWYAGRQLPLARAFSPAEQTMLLMVGNETQASSVSYVKGVWNAALGRVDPGTAKGKPVIMRMANFYEVEPSNHSPAGGRVTHSTTLIDVIDLLRQAGHQVLPPSPLPQGYILPPSGLQGLPAPSSIFVDPADTLVSRQTVTAVLQREFVAQAGVADQWVADMRWYGPGGIGMASSSEDYQIQFLSKLYTALANVEMTVHSFPCEGRFCAALGTLSGDHVGAWLGTQPTGRRVHLHFASHWHVVQGSVLEGWTMLDLPDFLKQVGVDVFTLKEPLQESATIPAIAPVDAPQYNNTCLLKSQLNPPTVGAPATFLKDCAAWVINTTDALWHGDLKDVEAAAEEYFYANWSSASNEGSKRGLSALKSLVFARRAAIPDLHIHITDVACQGNDIDGYKTMMPDVLTGTHTGWGDLGAPTNRSVAFQGMALCYLQKVHGKWQYISEWQVHDTGSMMAQLGLPLHTGARAEPHDCKLNFPSWDYLASLVPKEQRLDALMLNLI